MKHTETLYANAQQPVNVGRYQHYQCSVSIDIETSDKCGAGGGDLLGPLWAGRLETAPTP